MEREPNTSLSVKTVEGTGVKGLVPGPTEGGLCKKSRMLGSGFHTWEVCQRIDRYTVFKCTTCGGKVKIRQ